MLILRKTKTSADLFISPVSNTKSSQCENSINVTKFIKLEEVWSNEITYRKTTIIAKITSNRNGNVHQFYLQMSEMIFYCRMLIA